MKNPYPLFAASVLALVLGVGTATANPGNGLGRPPTSDATLAVAPTAVDEGAGVSLTLTFTLGSSPSAITNGNIKFDTPGGWTLTAASIDQTSTCTTTNATVSVAASGAGVENVTCASGQTVVVDATVTTPDVTANTDYTFEGSFKSSPGGRKQNNNVWLDANKPVVTVNAV